MAITETIKHSVGLEAGPSTSTSAAFPFLCAQHLRQSRTTTPRLYPLRKLHPIQFKLTETFFFFHSRLAPGNVRRPPPHRLQRHLRPPADPAEPLPTQRVLPALEVRGNTRHLFPQFHSKPQLFSSIFSQNQLFSSVPPKTNSIPPKPTPSPLSPNANSNPSKQNERHSYEKCQYEEFKKRVAKMDELRAAKNGARSN